MLKRLSIKSRRLPSREAGCNATERSGSPSTPDNVYNLARAPDFQHCLELTKLPGTLEPTEVQPSTARSRAWWGCTQGWVSVCMPSSLGPLPLSWSSGPPCVGVGGEWQQRR